MSHMLANTISIYYFSFKNYAVAMLMISDCFTMKCLYLWL